MKYHVNAYDIDYCVEDEDVCSDVDNDPAIEEDSEEYYDAINKRIVDIKSQLPKRMSFDIECDDVNELEDLVCDFITEKTGWLINGFNYRYKEYPVGLLDHFGRLVKPGDKVVLLYKVYGFSGIDRAYLIDATYCGKGQWGHEFDWTNRQRYQCVIRIREPECIKIMKGVKRNA